MELRGSSERRLPPHGSLYVGHIKLPILGAQTFMLRVDSRSRTRITLIGAMNLDDHASFQVANEETDGSLRLQMEFNDPTLQLLASYRTRISATIYHPDGDYAVLVISPRWLPNIRVRLLRTAR